MKKILFIAIIVLMGLAGTKYYVSNQETSGSNLLLENVEALSVIEFEDYNPFCYNGGQGSSSCSIAGGITILGYGVSANCSVTCNTGYYACCGIRCTCKKI